MIWYWIELVYCIVLIWYCWSLIALIWYCIDLVLHWSGIPLIWYSIDLVLYRSRIKPGTLLSLVEPARRKDTLPPWSPANTRREPLSQQSAVTRCPRCSQDTLTLSGRPRRSSCSSHTATRPWLNHGTDNPLPWTPGRKAGHLHCARCFTSTCSSSQCIWIHCFNLFDESDWMYLKEG